MVGKVLFFYAFTPLGIEGIKFYNCIGDVMVSLLALVL